MSRNTIVGPGATELGVTYYEYVQPDGDWKQNKASYLLVHLHGNETVKGVVRIRTLSSGDGWLLQFVHHGQSWSLTLNEKTGKVLLQDNKDQIAAFSWDGKVWVAQREKSEDVLEENIQVVKLLAAVGSDFIERNSYPGTVISTTTEGCTSTWRLE